MILTAAALWGSTATVARLVFRDYKVPPLTMVELRLLIATLLLLVWIVLRNRAALRVERRDWGYFLILGVFGVASIQATYYYSISRLGVALSILLQYLAPALIVLWQAARGQRPTPTTITAVLAAV